MHALQLQPTPIHPSQPQRLLVIGDERLRETARPWLSGLDVAVDFRDRPEDLGQIPHDDLIGVVVLGDPSSIPPGNIVQRLRWRLDKRSRSELMPVILLVEGRVGDDLALDCYEQGASAVFGMGATAVELGLEDVSDLLPRTLAAHLARGPVPALDRALTRQGRIRLQLASPRFARLDLEVADGEASVRGAVRKLSGHLRVEKILTATPGIRTIDSSGLRIASRATDAHLVSQVDAAIERIVDEPSELQRSVDNGHIVLAGSVSSREELRRLSKAVRQVPGARELENYAVIEPQLD